MADGASAEVVTTRFTKIGTIIMAAGASAEVVTTRYTYIYMYIYVYSLCCSIHAPSQVSRIAWMLDPKTWMRQAPTLHCRTWSVRALVTCRVHLKHILRCLTGSRRLKIGCNSSERTLQNIESSRVLPDKAPYSPDRPTRRPRALYFSSENDPWSMDGIPTAHGPLVTPDRPTRPLRMWPGLTSGPVSGPS